MYLSGSPEESRAEPCLRCSSVAVLTCPSIVFTWQKLRIWTHEGQALWGMLRLEFGKSNFQEKSLQLDNETRQKCCCLEKQLQEWEPFPQTQWAPWGTSAPCDEARCKDPSAGHRANGGNRSRRAVSLWSSDQACLPCSEGNMPWFQKGPSFRLCTVLNVQTSLGFALGFCKCSIDILAYSLTQRISLGTWKGRSSFSLTTGQCRLSRNTLLTNC